MNKKSGELIISGKNWCDEYYIALPWITIWRSGWNYCDPCKESRYIDEAYVDKYIHYKRINSGEYEFIGEI